MRAILAIVAGMLVGVSAFAETEKLVLGAGCFWCVEAAFKTVPGVVSVTSGYSGGSADDANYGAVSAKRTDHIEVVEIEFDPEKVAYSQFFDVFWAIHDPTDGRGVAPDFGPPYRPVIFYNGEDQLAAAKVAMEAEQTKYDKPLATLLEPLEAFYPAEEYHQDYVKKNPGDVYVRRVAVPKVEKAKKVQAEAGVP